MLGMLRAGGMSAFHAEKTHHGLRTCTDYHKDQLKKMGMPPQTTAAVFAGMEFDGFRPV